MTPIAAMVKEMIARGVDADTIALAVETAETTAGVCGQSADKAESADDRRRRLDRERKRLVRGMSAESADNPRNVQSAHISEDKNSKKEEELDAPAKPKSADRRGHRLPDDWLPTPQDWATTCAMHGEQVAQLELAKFKDHWKSATGKGSAKADWNAAWRNWSRNIRTWGNNANRAANPRATERSPLVAAAHRKAEQFFREDTVAGSADAMGFAERTGAEHDRAPGFAGPLRGAGDGVGGFEFDGATTIEGEARACDEARRGIGNGPDVGFGSRRSA